MTFQSKASPHPGNLMRTGLSRRQFCSISGAAIASLYTSKAFSLAASRSLLLLRSLPTAISSGSMRHWETPFTRGREACSPTRSKAIRSFPWPRTRWSVSKAKLLFRFKISASGFAGRGPSASRSLLFLSDLPAGETRTYKLVPHASRQTLKLRSL